MIWIATLIIIVVMTGQFILLVQIIEKLNEKLMATLADLDAEIATDLTTSVDAIIAALQAKASSDTQPEIDKLKALSASIKAALNPPPPPTT